MGRDPDRAAVERVSGPVVDVVGLGPAGPDLLTSAAAELLASARPTFLRTSRHPSASAAPGAATFDHLYERAESIEAVYRGIVEELVEAAGRHGGVVYAVPGSPVVAEHTVELLLADDRVHVVVHAALSFLDLTWARLGVDPVQLGVRLVDGHRFAAEAAGERGPLLVGQCDSAFVLSDIKLSVDEEPERPVVLLRHLGLSDEQVVEVRWEDLDRSVVPDHLTSLWIPRLAAPVASEVARFDELVRRLRVSDPWKADQDHDSLKRFLLEEAYEVLEAIDAYDPVSGDGADELAAELGDLLYQVVFHAAIASEAGWFDLSDVARSIHDKLERRNEVLLRTTDGRPAEAGADGAVAAWEASKRDEHDRRSVFDGIPRALPALTRAVKVGRTAAALGLSGGAESLGSGGGAESLGVGAGDAAAALREAADAMADRPDVEDVGALLAAAVMVAVDAGIDPEDALRRRLDVDEARYRELEK